MPNYELVKTAIDGNGMKHFEYEHVKAVSSDKQKLVDYCKTTFGKDVQPENYFSWDREVYIIREFNALIL